MKSKKKNQENLENEIMEELLSEQSESDFSQGGLPKSVCGDATEVLSVEIEESMDTMLGSVDQLNEKYSKPEEGKENNDETLQLDADLPSIGDEEIPKGEQKKVSKGKKKKNGVETLVGKFFERPKYFEKLHGGDSSLSQSEYLRLAQEKILDLEEELERLREENESLGAAGETLSQRSDELQGQVELSKEREEEAKEVKEEQRHKYENMLDHKNREVKRLKEKEGEYERRLTTNIQKIRVRERELENRLELVKREGAALSRNKDEIILDMKRQLDQINMEISKYRDKGKELVRRLDDKQDRLGRTVKALRLALTLLEEEDGSEPVPLKRVE